MNRSIHELMLNAWDDGNFYGYGPVRHYKQKTDEAKELRRKKTKEKKRIKKQKKR